jgi:hypothetical protein
VRPTLWLDIDKGIPIYDDAIWTGLSFTRGLEKDSIGWTGKIRGSLKRLADRDRTFLAENLAAQAARGTTYPVSPSLHVAVFRETFSDVLHSP